MIHQTSLVLGVLSEGFLALPEGKTRTEWRS